jgi:hypothetical protein
MRSQVNMTWNNVPHHHTKKFVVCFPDCGVMDYIFVMACRDKITCREKKIKVFFFNFVNKKGFHMIHHDVHVCKLHLYKVY